MTTKDVKDRIKFLLYKLEMNGKKFGEECGVSGAAISEITRDGTLSGRTLEKIARRFNVNCNWFIFGTGEPFMEQEELVIQN